jgi:hypothetical protein
MGKNTKGFGMGVGRYCSTIKSNDVNVVQHNGNGTH